MNRLLALALISLFLTACGTSPVKDDSHASDLDALVSGVKANAKPRLLPNGKEYCVELAKTDEAKDDCALDLEDANYLNHSDKNTIVWLVEKFADRMRLTRNPCGFWEKFTRNARCKNSTTR